MILLTYFYLAERGGVYVAKRSVHITKEGVHVAEPK